LLPPSWETLKERLAGRHEDSQSAATRLANARAELEASKRYDYIVVNDDLEAAVSQVECIITAESLKSSRREFFGMP
jgi:guanylate kinase